MSLFGLVSGPIKAYTTLAGAIAAAAAVAALALWHHHQVSQVAAAARAEGLAQGRAELADYRGQVERQALQQATQRQAQQTGLSADLKEIDREAERLAARDRARIVDGTRAADAADQRLQQRIDAARAPAAGGGGLRPGAGAFGGCQAEPGPEARLLAASRRAIRQLGRDADDELADVDQRLGHCVAEYEAVRTRVNGPSAAPSPD